MNKDANRLTEQEGIYSFGYACARFGYLFRNVKDHDKGIDAEIEITQSLDLPSSIIGVQVKARSKVKKTRDGIISVTVTQQNLNYWRTYGRPVILVLYDTETKSHYWTRVDNATDIRIGINYSQLFDENALKDLVALISAFYRKVVRSMKTKIVSAILSELQLGDCIELVVGSLEQKLCQAQIYIQQQKYKEASRIYEALSELYSSCLISFNNGMCLLLTEQVERAIELANSMIRDYPNRHEPLELLANSLAYSGDYETALHYLQSCLKLERKAASVWNSLGLIHYELGDYSTAISEFTVSHDIEADAEVCFNIALCLTAVKRFELALDYYNFALEFREDFSEAHNNKGLLLKSFGRIEEAVASFELGIKFQPDHLFSLCNLAYIYKDLGRDEESIRLYNTALAVEDEVWDEYIHYNLALLNCRIGEYDKASYHFERGLSIFKTDQSGLGFVLDIGYEVAYAITFLVSQSTIQVEQAKNISELVLSSKPAFRRIFEMAKNQANTIPLLPDTPDQHLKKTLRDEAYRRHVRTRDRVDKRGLWVMGRAECKDGNESASPPFICFNVSGEEYFNLLKKEITKRLLLVEGQRHNEHVRIDSDDYLRNEIVLIPSRGRIEIQFKRWLTGECYFHIDFNGYSLSGVASGNADDIFSEYKKSEKEHLVTIMVSNLVNKAINTFTIMTEAKITI